MAKRPTDKVKLKVWTERSTAEIEGPILSAVYHLFMFVKPEDREKLLQDMRQWHDDVVEAGS